MSNNLWIINASPRMKGSASSLIINDMQKFIPANTNYEVHDFHKASIYENLSDEELEKLYGVDAILFVFPIYYDSFPAHLINCLQELEATKDKFANGQNLKIYACIHCGLYDAHQVDIAIEMLKIWTSKVGATFGMAMGFGASAALHSAKKEMPGQGIKKGMPRVFGELFEHISTGSTGENVYFTIDKDEKEYFYESEQGWRKLIARNGLVEDDLDRKITI